MLMCVTSYTSNILGYNIKVPCLGVMESWAEVRDGNVRPRPGRAGCYSWAVLFLIDSIKPGIKPSLMKTIKGKFDRS